MEDKTLKRGDAVVTKSGIRIFVGVQGPRHEPGDFKKPSAVRGLSRAERKALAALEGESPATRIAKDTLAGRSATEAGPSEAKYVTGANGRTIRYVGP